MQTSATSIRVLHVDDEPDFADLAATYLEREDDRFDVETATSASDALELLADGSFDCVVSDHEMPETTGIELLETVRSRDPDLPFILFTGKGSEAVAADAISAGVTDYLQKETGSGQYTVLANRVANAVESHRIEHEVERTRTQFRAIAEHSADAIVTIDEESYVQFANPAVEDVFGHSPAELEGKSLTTLMPDGLRESHLDAVKQYVETGERAANWSNVEFAGLRKDGSEVPISVSFGEFEQNGKRRFIGIIRDRSDRTQITTSERESEFLAAIVETVGVGVAAYREDGTFAYVNDVFAANLEADRETIEGARVWEITPELDREDFGAYWGSFEAGDTRTTETVHAFSGTEVPVETVTTCTVIDGTTYHVGTARDITDRKEEEERFQAFVEQSNDILTILDKNGIYQYQSPSAQRILGYESGGLIGDSAFEHIHPDDRADVVSAFQQVMTNPGQDLVVEYRFRHADGSWRWLESRGVNPPDSSVIDGFLINSRDVTDRKNHERQIGDLHDATREMVQANDEREVCAVAVETAEEVLGHSVAGVWLRDEDGDRLEPVATTGAAEELFGDHPVYIEGNSLSWRAYADGESMIVDDIATESGLYNPDTEVGSELIIPLGGYGVLNVGSRETSAFSDNEVTLAKLLAANAQVALGRSERERLLERQTDQMEFFNSILRHDVLNAITVIRSRAEFLAAELDGEQLQDAETIVRWSDDVTEIVQRVRTVLETLAGEGNPELEPIDLATELRAEVDRIRTTYPEVTFETDVPEQIPVLANDLLGDVLGNIVTNAIEHNDTEGLQVSVSAERADDDVLVRIADNGTGVAEERREAIFRRGETGHAKSIGSGFGLFFADVMVEEYDGDVWVEDNDDGGATFVVQLSALDSGPAL